MKLGDNIRNFRKQRSLTREQLAEVLGVTPGAVYKWEAKLSVPELDLIIEIADFFDTSVDALLGYEMKDNRLAATVERLKQYQRDKDRAGLSEAEKALKKYPNTFDIVHESSALYRGFGLETREKTLLCRSRELLEKSLLLLPQNTDPEISELTIYGEMADVYMSLGEYEKAIALLKKHNAGGHYNDRIGQTLAADLRRPEEAVTFLSEALLIHAAALINTVIGYVNVFSARGDFLSAQAILLWGIGLVSGLRETDTPSFLDKVNGVFHIELAYAQLRSGNADGARRSLKEAQTLAQRFDSAPSYAETAIRFMNVPAHMTAYDNLGTTAADSLENTMKDIGDDSLTALWKEMTEQKA